MSYLLWLQYKAALLICMSKCVYVRMLVILMIELLTLHVLHDSEGGLEQIGNICLMEILEAFQSRE
jgi:hypothetical protein